MKVYEVTLSYTAHVVAEDADDAREWALQHRTEIHACEGEPEVDADIADGSMAEDDERPWVSDRIAGLLTDEQHHRTVHEWLDSGDLAPREVRSWFQCK